MSVAKRDRYGAARKKIKKTAVFAPLSFLLVAVAVVFALGVFFRVQTIEVEGSQLYSAEEIIEASGVDVGDNLFFINSGSVTSRIYSRLSQVERATVELKMPNKVIIHIEESYALAYVTWEGQPWMLTGNCKLLGAAQPEELPGLIQVLNVSPVDPEAGQPMQVAEEDSLKLSYLQELLGAIEELNMVQDVGQMDMSNPASPTFQYQRRFTVRMGANNNTDYKLRMLLSAVSQLGPDEMGILNLSNGVEVHYTPD